MNHFALPRFWSLYRGLPVDVQRLADKNFALLQQDPYHPSLHFKCVNKGLNLWSARVGSDYRVLARRDSRGFHWFWIGTHAQYDKLI
jgi:hypothetical protein